MPTSQEPLTALVQQRTLIVNILLFPDVEILDFAGPYEVFSVASRICGRASVLRHPPFELCSVAAERSLVKARHGLGVMADAGFAKAPPCDVLIVPGGVVTQAQNDPATLEWLRRAAAHAGLTASVCTGAFILAQAGLLQHCKATTHWEDIPELRRAFPDLDVIEAVPYVDLGTRVTSAGISAGIGMSLHLVGRILGAEVAQATARQMQYDWVDR